MRVKNEMDEDEQGKLFVGGLSWETTQDSLQRYFGRYGEVIDCVVMKNPETGRSRGFGFVTFSDPDNVSLVLQNGPHNLDGRTIDPKPCNPRTLQKPKRNNSYPKVFLGGLPSNVTETDLRTYFARFGKVMEVVIMYDQEKKKSRGFGFLSFEDEEAVERCVAEHFVNLSGKQVEIKKAEPRDANKMGDGVVGGGVGGSGAGSSWGPPSHGMGVGGMGYSGMGMGGGGGGMGGHTMGSLGPMGPATNMMQGYQSWGSTPQSYPSQWGPSNQPPLNGYAAPSGPGGYQGWGAPPGPQGQQMPHQWGSNYAAPPQQTGYSSYDMYSRGGGGGGGGPAGPTPPGPSGPPKTVNDYSYTGYTAQYQQESSGGYGGGGGGSGGRSFAADAAAAAANPPPGEYGSAPGPQRYNVTPQSYHPYRRN